MNYALVEDGEIVDMSLPDTGFLPDGSAVSGFNKLDPETLRECGWIPIEDAGPPEYDSETQQVQMSYIVGAETVIAVYTVVDIPEPDSVPDPGPTLEERITTLEELVASLTP